MNWLVILRPAASTIAGATFFAWKWTNRKVKGQLAYGKDQILKETKSACIISLGLTCFRWFLYIMLLLLLVWVVNLFGRAVAGAAVLAILIKYFYAMTVGCENILLLWKSYGKNAFIHPYASLEDWLVRKTAMGLEAKLSESLIGKVAFYITLHNIEKEARTIVTDAMPGVKKIIWITVAAYGILLFFFGYLYQIILETCLDRDFINCFDYWLWPFTFLLN